jgi:hypothetical protein
MDAPPHARLLPRSPGQRARAGVHALAIWSLATLERLAAGVVLVVPVLLLVGLVLAMAFAVTAPRRGPALLVAPPPPPPDTCGRMPFDRPLLPAPAESVSPSSR